MRLQNGIRLNAEVYSRRHQPLGLLPMPAVSPQPLGELSLPGMKGVGLNAQSAINAAAGPMELQEQSISSFEDFEDKDTVIPIAEAASVFQGSPAEALGRYPVSFEERGPGRYW